jgi:phytoene synthase
MPPYSPDRRFASEDDRAKCRALIQAGSKSFAAASLLLPSRVREPAFALYAFCRISDDLVDVGGGKSDAIIALRSRLERAYAGQPADDPVDRAFADAIHRFAIPRELPEALIEGFEWDVQCFSCETLSDLRAYAARVAGSVGVMMSVLMGVRDPRLLARACDLGVAMQMTNIARDVGEDARAGRLYLPREWLRSAGLDPDAWLRDPRFCPEIATVVRRLLAEADVLYRRADQGIAGLPAACRPGIMAARHLYHAIGLRIARADYDSVNSRARVGNGAKLVKVMTASIHAHMPARRTYAPDALAEASYLIDAVTVMEAQAVVNASSSPVGVSGRIVWVAELFARLETRQNGGMVSTSIRSLETRAA